MPNFTPIGVIAEVKNMGGFTSDLTKMDKTTQKTSKSMDSAGKSSKGFSQNLLTVQSALAGLGLAGITSQLGQFVVESFHAAAAAERLFAATDNLAKGIGSSGDAMVSAITAASNETISKTDAMSAANKALLFDIVENEQEMGRLTEIAITLGAAMGQDATKSLDDLTTALGRQSPMILDNLGITLKLEEAYRIYANQLGKTASQLTETEKKQAFVNAALIKGEERVAALGGVTIDAAAQTEQLSAAWSDFTVAFGGLMTQMSGGISTVTSFVRALEGGATAWQGIFGRMAEHQALADAMILEEAAAEGNVFAIQKLAKAKEAEMQATIASNKATFSAAVAAGEYNRALGEEAEALTQTEILSKKYGVEVKGSSDKAITAYWERADGAKKAAAEEAKAFQEALEAQQAMILGIKSSQADYFNELRNLQNQAVAGEADFTNQMTSIRTTAAEEQKAEATALSDELAGIEEERQAKLHWVLTGAHARTAAENDENLAHWNAHFDELKATAEAKTREKTDAILAEQQRASAATKAAQDAEKAELESHLEELKLKTALSVLETTGQLEQLTGLVGVSAGEAAELINAGVLPVTRELGLAIQDTMIGMESSMAQATTTATTNQNMLDQALSGTLQSAQELEPALTPIMRPFDMLSQEKLPLLQETSTTTFGMMSTQTDTFTQGPMVALDTSFATLNTMTLPQTQSTYQSVFQQMINITNQLITTVNRLITSIGKIGEVAKSSVAEAVEAFEDLDDATEDAADGIEDNLIPALKEVNSILQETINKAREATGVLGGLGASTGVGMSDGAGFNTGLGFAGGLGFANGLGLGFTVPSGFPNDSFGPLFVETGEQVLVTPRGTSIDEVVMDRLSSMPLAMGGMTVNVNVGSVNNGMDVAMLTNVIEQTVSRAM